MIFDIKTNYFTRLIMILKVSCVFFLTCNVFSAYSQSNEPDLALSFVKQNDSIKAGDIHFNVLRIVNKTSSSVTGSTNFKVPENWKLIAFPSDVITIQPGDSALFPVRVSPSADAIGGISYILNGSFHTQQKQYNSNAYLTIPAISKWEFYVEKNSIYFPENEKSVAVKIRVINRGNRNELIKLDLQVGKLLALENLTPDNYQEYVKLPAFKDSTITYNILYKKDLSYDEKIRYENNWKETAVNVTASSDLISKSSTVMVKKLNSVFVNQRLQNASPLNVDYQLFNLMSNQLLRSNLKVYGTILYPKNAELQYMASVQNVYVGSESTTPFNIERQLLYTLLYNSKKNKILLGYNVSGGELHGINGRGISGEFKINQTNQLSYTLVQNPYSQSLGASVGYATTLNKLSLSTELTHESQYVDNAYSANSASFGFGFSFLKHHNLSFQLLGSQSKYKLPSGIDTTLLGFSYKMSYSVRYKKINFNFSALNSTNNYILNSGYEQYYVDGRYSLSDKVDLNLYGNRYSYKTTNYPYNFTNPAGYNSADYFRFLTSISVGNLLFQVGPNYVGSYRLIYDASTGYKSDYQTLQPGIWGALTFRLNNYRTLTPNVTVSNLRFFYKSNDPTVNDYSSVNNVYYSVGLNYYDRIWRLNAYYTSGSTSDLYRNILVDSKAIVSKSLQIRPSYENYFFKRTVKLSAFVNYAYYMPSGRENMSYNVRYDHFLKGGWMFSVSGFIYSNSTVNENQNRTTTKDMNFIVGFTKSFNIQQPRLKYYDLKAVFFNDLDGNGTKSNNEPPVSNILVNIQKDRTASKLQSNIPEVELLSDNHGTIEFDNLPKDTYNLSFNPMVNLQNLYFLKGTVQKYVSDKTRTLYVPLAESYKVKGKVILVRDINSTEGKIDVEGIRVLATGTKGETYSALTDNFGAYVISVPRADKYKVHVSNVFGAQFEIDSNESEVQFSDNKTISLDFTFTEKKRGIQFENGELFKFSSLEGQSANAMAATSAKADSIQNQVATVSKVPTKQEAAKTQKATNGKQPVQPSAKSKSKTKPNTANALTVPASNDSISKVQTAVGKATLNAPAKTTTKSKAQTAAVQPSDTLASGKSIVKLSSSKKIETIKPTETKAAPVVDKAKKDDKTTKLAVKTQPDSTSNTVTKKVIMAEPVRVESDDVKLEDGQVYTIQLDVLKQYVDPATFKVKYNYKEDVYYIERNGDFTYFIGSYISIDAAKAAITRYGMMGYIVMIDKTQLKTGK